jgi:hypothetical protein
MMLACNCNQQECVCPVPADEYEHLKKRVQEWDEKRVQRNQEWAKRSERHARAEYEHLKKRFQE